MAPQTISIKIDGLPPSPNAIHSVRQKMAVKKEWRDMAFWLAKEIALKRRMKPFEHALVHFHISTGDNRTHDADNLNWAVTKPTLDGIKGVLIVDDSIDHVDLSYSYDREKPRGFKVTVVQMS
jgi:hypothetical protein